MTHKFSLALVAALGLSACQSTQDSATKSGFASPNSGGTIGAGIENNFNKINRVVRDSNGGGYAYASGTLNGDGFGAYSGLLPGTRVGTAAPAGTAAYDATYSLTEISGIDLNGNLLSGTSFVRSGSITLNVNVANGTLRGADSRLTVIGDLEANNTLGGNVSWRGVSGPLDGLISADDVIGVFHGNDENLIFAGGLIGSAR